MQTRPHVVAIGTRRTERMTAPDPKLLADVVPSKILDAWRAASATLARANIRHIVIGGLAVGANGYPRATKDVDFLIVADEAFVRHGGGVVTLNPALPISVDDVMIDYLAPKPGEEHLAAALTAPMGSFIDAPRLVYMKLRAGRHRDRGDVIGLVNAGLDVDATRGYLVANAPELVSDFDKLVEKAPDEV
jgi:hypothetical protein